MLGRRTLLVDEWHPEITKTILFVVTLILPVRFKKPPEPLVVLAAAVISLLLYPLRG